MLVTFDLDGVLQVNPFHRGVFPEIAALVAPHLARQEGIPLVEARDQVVGRITARARERLQAGDWVGAYDWDAHTAEVARSVGYPGPIDVAALVRKYCRQGYIELYPGARETLSFLRRQGAGLMVVSNGFDKYQRPVLEALGIAPFFSHRVTPEQVGTAKPDPAIFHAALAAAGMARPVRAGAALHVGDTLVHDVYGAKRAGLAAVWVLQGLPAPWRGLAPWERPHTADFAAVAEEALARQPDRHAYPGVDVGRCRPDHIVQSLAELRAVYRWQSARAAGGG